mgnify:CR=1 FL=1
MAVLAAITVKVGFDILDWSFLGRAHRISVTSTLIMYGVLLLTVLVDLLVAVGIGVFVANILTIERLSNMPSTKVKTIDPSGDPVVVNDEEQQLLEQVGDAVVLFHLSGPMIFGIAAEHHGGHSTRERGPRRPQPWEHRVRRGGIARRPPLIGQAWC